MGDAQPGLFASSTPSVDGDGAEAVGRPRLMSTDSEGFPEAIDDGGGACVSGVCGEEVAASGATSFGPTSGAVVDDAPRASMDESSGSEESESEAEASQLEMLARRLEAMADAGALPDHLLDPPPRAPLLETFDCAGVARYCEALRARAEAAARRAGRDRHPLGHGAGLS